MESEESSAKKKRLNRAATLAATLASQPESGDIAEKNSRKTTTRDGGTNARRDANALSHANRRQREAAEQAQVRRAANALSQARRQQDETAQQAQASRAANAVTS